MKTKIAIAAVTLLSAMAASAQTTNACTCNSGAVRTVDANALATLLGNKMVCGNVGNEVWQEHHNGSATGSIVDYKLGPTDPRDPSTTVGTYSVNSDNTVTYTYGSASYKYDVCYVSGTNSYTFCGAQYGGRNITGVRIGGGGLSSCAGITVVPPAATATTNRLR